MVYHELVSLVQMTLVVADGRGGLVVHHELDALAVGIVVEHLYVEVRIRSDEIEHIVFGMAEPVFPALIPTFDQHLVEAVGGGKVDVLLDMLVIGAVTAVGFGLGIVGLAQLDGKQVVGIGPGALAGNHLPPHAHILHRLDPGHVVVGTGLVEVERDARSEDVAGVVAHDDRSPRRGTGCLQVALVALSIGGEPGFEHQVLVVQVEVHAGVVDEGCLMQVDVEAVGGLHLQGRLHACGRELGLRGVVGDGAGHQAADFGKAGFGIVILLCIVIAWNPEGRVVARHGKLGMFFLDDEVVEVLLQGEFVAEAQAVVEEAEAEDDVTVLCLLVERHSHLVVVVADFLLFSPDGLPGLVERGGLHAGQGEAVHQAGVVLELQPQLGRLDDYLIFIIQLIDGLSLRIDAEVQAKLAVGRNELFGPHAGGYSQEEQQKKES